jgi:GTP-binding protein
MGSNRTGRDSEDVKVPVPLGTDVFDAESGARLGEVLMTGQEVIAARGGRGGRGNARFVSSTRQSPRTAESGKPGEERKVRLVLRLLADIGIVGLPNAGKSTLLGRLTRARPKVASYPFTTLTPNLGVMRTRDLSYTVADMPGIIRGAHEGKGLGLWFLRHIERTRMLVFVLDASAGHAKEDYTELLEEIRSYQAGILKRPRIVVLNKLDLVAGRRPGLRFDVPAVWVSALTGQGVDELNRRVVTLWPATGSE